MLYEVITVRNHVWTVVGHFRGAGAQDSEVWIDLPVAQSAFRRGGTVSTVRVLVTDPATLPGVAREIRADPRLTAELSPEPEFYAEQSRDRARLIESFAYLVSAIMRNNFV